MPSQGIRWVQRGLEHESDANLGRAEHQQWAEPFRRWSFFGGGFSQPNQEQRGRGGRQKKDKTHLSNFSERCAGTRLAQPTANCLQAWEQTQDRGILRLP